MLTRIARLFDRPDATLKTLAPPDRLHLAAACLMLEAARLDDSVTRAERDRIHALLAERFGLTAAETAELMAAADGVLQGPAQWHAFTSRLKDGLSYEERVALIEMLWEVVYADGELHHLESSLMRRVGGLLYVSDRDRGDARRRALRRLGRPDTEPTAPERSAGSGS